MRIEIVLFDGCDELDAIGPFEVLANARPHVDVRLVTLTDRAWVTAAHGARIAPGDVLSSEPDLIVVPGGGWVGEAALGVRAEVGRSDLSDALSQRHARGTIVASVCTGAMLLARAGLLAGRPAVTHHAAIDDLRAAGAIVIDDARVVDDGDILSAGGVTSGLDLALWIVERELGGPAAERVAREMEHERRSRIWPRDFADARPSGADPSGSGSQRAAGVRSVK